MKLIVLEALENLPEGIELEYEAVEQKITINTDFADRQRFEMFDVHVNDLIRKFEDKGCKVTYDNITSGKFNEVLQHSRFVVMRKPKEEKC